MGSPFDRYLPTAQPTPVAALAAGGLILRDAFDGAGALDAHAIAPVNAVRATWGGHADQFALAGGAAVCNTTTFLGAMLDGMAYRRAFSARLRFTGSESANLNAGVIVRAEAKNFSTDITSFTVHLYPLSDEIVIREYPSGIDRASAPVTIDLGAWYVLKVVDDGATLSGYVNDVLRVRWSSALGYGNAYAGLRARVAVAGEQIEFDWFAVTA
ncbi:MAG: hypothetical protein Kow00120_23770 [Anaerolineae bacterium]